MKMFLETALSFHGKCFICNYSDRKLHVVHKESVYYAYKKHNMVIKFHARVCSRHLDENKLIKHDHFLLIKKTKKEYYSSYCINMFDSLMKNTINCQKTLGIFEKFKNLETLDEKHCLEITRWTKTEFIAFSKYITSIRETNGRTKEELIAIYRYWLRKGIDQNTLALLIKNIKQQEVSNYLRQIRTAINKDFVPYFLGAKSRNREFYLNHNNVTTTTLYKLNKNELAIFIDGTYCRLEKSSNNNFQYSTYSEQKQDNLIKPFLICCADGYIIDCYGPFQANHNDSKIFDHILKTDKELNCLLKHDKTYIFLDRGFRDIYQKLIDEYHFYPKIPTCQQKKKSENEKSHNKRKQLTTKETSESRLVTKIRFIIEKNNAFLKHHKSLDNIKNNQVGHIAIDYRIACAMLNFTHNPDCPDGKNAKSIATKIRKKTEIIQINKLEFLLRKHLETKHIQPIKLSEINDFVKLTEDELKKNIFYGTFQLKQSKSYMEELITNGKAFIISKALACQIQDNELKSDLITEKSKIIAVEITSRHKRGMIKLTEKNDKGKFRNNYRVFIHYEPRSRSFKSIKNYVCSCKSGLKIAGCCIHVATAIYYLSCTKHSTISFPGKHLESICIDINKMDKPPNDPKYIKGKRLNKRPKKSTVLKVVSKDTEDDLITLTDNLEESNDSKKSLYLTTKRRKDDFQKID